MPRPGSTASSRLRPLLPPETRMALESSSAMSRVLSCATLHAGLCSRQRKWPLARSAPQRVDVVDDGLCDSEPFVAGAPVRRELLMAARLEDLAAFLGG